MRIERLAPGERRAPLGAIFGAVLAGAALAAAAWIESGLPRPGCPLRALTGLPCPTCGATRLVEALVDGRPAAAFGCNPPLFVAGAGVAAWAVLSAAWWLFGLPKRRLVLEQREARWLRGLAVAAVLAGWAYLAWRGV